MTETTLRVMPREMRLMSERVLSLTALPKGFALMVGDMVMYSQAMGLGGFALLLDRMESLSAADPARLTLIDGATPVLDAQGEHGWFVVPSLMDLLEDQLLRGPTATLEIVNVTDAEELRVATGLGQRRGLKIAFEGTRATATRDAVADPVLDTVMAHGCDIPADFWWTLYHTAQTALTPDSVVSRRHAGVNIVLEDGRIIGRSDNDDDTDARFISRPDTPTQTEPARRGGE
ncbi:MAG: hypothetical protein ABNH26_05605 [Celeribacter sp.]|jgi:hypothetical protein